MSAPKPFRTKGLVFITSFALAGTATLLVLPYYVYIALGLILATIELVEWVKTGTA